MTFDRTSVPVSVSYQICGIRQHFFFSNVSAGLKGNLGTRRLAEIVVVDLWDLNW
jgi:hypothetical protein